MSEVMTGNCSKSQMDLAKQANKYLLEHMDRHITIREFEKEAVWNFKQKRGANKEMHQLYWDI